MLRQEMATVRAVLSRQSLAMKGELCRDKALGAQRHMVFCRDRIGQGKEKLCCDREFFLSRQSWLD